jgi:hypothetical protein
MFGYSVGLYQKNITVVVAFDELLGKEFDYLLVDCR